MDALAQIAAQLGHPPGEPCPVSSLNEVPPEVIEDARRLPSVPLRVIYLRHRLPFARLGELVPFIADCIDGDAPVATWGRGRTVRLAAELPDLVSAPAHALLAPLLVLGPIRTLGSGPGLHFEAGAPVVVLPDVDYRWAPPLGLQATVFTPDAPLVADPIVAFRRWVAVWLAWQAGFVEVPADADAETALRLLVPDAATFTEDARIAARAWLVQRARGASAYDAPDALLRAVELGAGGGGQAGDVPG
ncbi:MAG: hypothetical protein KC549_09860 [Myxococcales bacterium]|nr:hypothetical protein [Myxococcales bacterium]